MSGSPSGKRGRLAASWEENATAWTAAVREGRIASRRLATDAAILSAVRDLSPRRALDVGCGEGWLCRALAAEGVDTLGVDASAPLVAAARAAGGGRFEVLDYATLASAGLGSFDVAVCNFALLDDAVEPALRALRTLCAPAGHLVLQTVHPWSACGEGPYASGWREEDFAGFGPGFGPMPWYFRTLEDWLSGLDAAGWRLRSLKEPGHPETGQPVSLLLVATGA